MMLSLDLFDDPTAWSLQDPDSGASDRIAVSSVEERMTGRPAIRVTAADAVDHTAEVEFAFVDLNPFEDLQFWARSSAPSDGRAGFVAELSFGATNLDPDAPSNGWRRHLPIAVTGQWELITLSITDFPERVRNRCNRMRIRFATARMLTLDLTEVAAVRNTPLSDVERALVTLLDQRLAVDGTPVAAVVAPDPPPGPEAHFRIRHLAATSGAERQMSGERRTDFTDTGFLQRPPIEPLDLEYAVDAVASSRAHQQLLADFLIQSIDPYGYLEVNGVNAPMEWSGPMTSPGDPAGPSVPLRIAVPRPTSFDRRLSRRPYSRVEITVGHP